MAERGGFEPPVEFSPYDGLAKPLPLFQPVPACLRLRPHVAHGEALGGALVAARPFMESLGFDCWISKGLATDEFRSLIYLFRIRPSGLP